ncbi:MAG: acyl-CoA dehydrogenase family protein, partial [Nocardioides sp.]|uniref:acyl-CoA dehydrogenase family protein n=1 Tax=Nocardioides sp. TaxID=35761 RepID=UPI0032632A99
PVEVCIAFEALGRHAAPGPWVESAAYLPIALGHEVEGVSTVAVPPHVPYALDADVADRVFLVDGDALVSATVREVKTSIDGTRRLGVVSAAASPAVEEGRRPVTKPDLDPAFDLAVLATAAQLLGAGERILADSVTYVKQRKQFGREIGSYQAIKHQLADVRIALDFARPLIDGAAVLFDGPDRARDVSAAKVAAGDAAYLASRVGLQVHGAIGYTAEFDLSLWLLKVRALVTAWGAPDFHRGRVLESLTS